MEAKATLNHYRQSPRKVRLVANLIRGKSVAHARSVLSFTDNKSAPALKKLIDSVVANSGVNDKQASGFLVKEIRVDTGTTMKRHRPMSRGRANQYRKRSSRIAVMLGEPTKTEKKKAPATKKTAKKGAVKKTAGKK